MLRRSELFIFLFFSLLTAKSQTGWQEWEKIYNDESMLVELQIYISDNSCDDDGRQFKYRTRLTGQYRTKPFFVSWKMNYFDCNGSLFYMQNATEIWSRGGGYVNGLIFESLDNRFTATGILQTFYDVNTSKSGKTSSGYLPKSYSIKADIIEYAIQENYAELTAKGGYLGPEAQWHWYQNKCKGKGKLLGKGKTIRVSPQETTTYFVRGEGDDWKSECIQITIPGISDGSGMVVRADTAMEIEIVKSNPPTGIIGQKMLCAGDSALLIVSGGSLGTNANWVWYSNHSLKRIATGDSVFVKPELKTIYRVRAERYEDTTNSVALELNVMQKSSELFNIIYKGKPLICEGEKVELEVDNFLIDDDGIWNWYIDSCPGTIVATGAFVEFYPEKTTTYHLRRDGTCNSFNCAAYVIRVNKKSSIKNARIIAPDTVYEGEKITLSVAGGNLGKEAKWNWYKDTCLPEKFIGSGETMVIEPRKTTRYFVKAIGLCNETLCIEIEIKPLKPRSKAKKS